jgi:uncharacterized protein
VELLKGFIKDYSKIRDPIYGFIELPDKFKPIIDHKLFQRLRRIGQLPIEEMVYPSSKHSRFEHSLGTMYLAMMYAIAIIENYSGQLKIFFETSTSLKHTEKTDEMKQQFIFSAGLIGLLHDIGHAPFSHTMEDALKNVFDYNHELIGTKIIEVIEKDLDLTGWSAFQIAKDVLNKQNKHETLNPVSKILRDMIDHPLIDVDKGDYLLRDSYHCGVNYGEYDFYRLWNFAQLYKNGDEYQIAFNKKVATEVWKIRFCRFSMFVNVYKHHIRQITDAMLINIIQKIVQKENLKDFLPINDRDEINWNEFVYWNDDTFLGKLSSTEEEYMNDFITRNLYKRYIEVPVENNDILDYDYIYKQILELEEFKKNNILKNDILFYKTKKIIPPVNEKPIQSIKIILDDDKIKSISDYFNFSNSTKIKNDINIIKIFVNKDKLGYIDNQDIKEQMTGIITPNLFNYNIKE